MSAPSTSKPGASATEPAKEDDAQATLGVLEEDDEFEEFAVAGTPLSVPRSGLCLPGR